ncbi:hypothetical protein N7454_004649 [Penicillium verhagenii]|nr:hypothetical protein N7454_004649 [Penicillium verhagenii]
MSFSKIQREDDSVYFGKVEKPQEDITFDEFTEALTKIPDEEIYPKPRLFCYEEYKEDDSTYVIPTLLIEEASVLETISQNPHPGIIKYHGCRVKRGFITGLVLDRKPSDLRGYVDSKIGPVIDEESFTTALKAAVEHLHSMGLAHNDINPANILLTEDQMPVLTDFNSCHPIGEKLKLSRGTEGWMDADDSWDTSETRHDFFAIEKIRGWLKEARESWQEGDALSDTGDV